MDYINAGFKNVWNLTENQNLILSRTLDNGNLWLGNVTAALDLNFLVDNNIEVIINCSPDIPFIDEILDPEHLCKQNKNYCRLNNLDKFRIPVFDSLLPHDIYKMEQYLPLVLPFILQKLLKEKKNVLVHCHGGIQRSACVISALLYVLKDCENSHSGKSECMKNIITYIRKCRPRVFRFGYSINFKKSLENYFNIKF